MQDSASASGLKQSDACAKEIVEISCKHNASINLLSKRHLSVKVLQAMPKKEILK